jgi:adenosylcobyric acid synthase
MGQTISQNCSPAFQILETPQGKADYFDGAISSNGLILGTCIHGLFHNTDFTHHFLNKLRQLRGLPTTAAISINRQEAYDKLAEIIRQNIDMSQIYNITFGRNYG